MTGLKRLTASSASPPRRLAFKLGSEDGADILFTMRSGVTAIEARGTLDVLVQALAYAKERYHLAPKPVAIGSVITSMTAPVCNYYGVMKRLAKFAG